MREAALVPVPRVAVQDAFGDDAVDDALRVLQRLSTFSFFHFFVPDSQAACSQI